MRVIGSFFSEAFADALVGEVCKAAICGCRQVYLSFAIGILNRKWAEPE